MRRKDKPASILALILTLIVLGAAFILTSITLILFGQIVWAYVLVGAGCVYYLAYSVLKEV